MKIKIIRGEYKNTVHEARTVPKLTTSLPDYQIIEGQLQGMIIDYMDCIVVDEGKTYNESQYNELAKKVTKLEEERTYLLKEINALKADKQLLLETIADDESNQKVELPREFAEAIEGALRVHRTKFDLIDSVNVGLRVGNRGLGGSVLKLVRFVEKNELNKDLLLAALVNGYTVKDEQTELEEQVYKMIVEWEHADCEGDAEDDRKQFSARLTSFFKENLQAT